MLLHLIHLHFLAACNLFTWSMIGPDPAPRRHGLRLRVIKLFISIAAHAYISKMMYAYIIPHNTPHTDNEIRSAAKWMYYGGDATELLILIVLFSTWYQKRERRPQYQLKPMALYN